MAHVYMYYIIFHNKVFLENHSAIQIGGGGEDDNVPDMSLVKEARYDQNTIVIEVQLILDEINSCLYLNFLYLYHNNYFIESFASLSL